MQLAVKENNELDEQQIWIKYNGIVDNRREFLFQV